MTRNPPQLALFSGLEDLQAVDLFAGGGGASEGIGAAIGVPPFLAVNHDPHAIAMHSANHPDTEHRCESVFDVDPIEACRGRRVDLLWASPDCTHFSRAKGGKPRDKNIRGLAWVVVKWAKAVCPRLIFLENVPEFRTWGPLNETGRVIKASAGETFDAWLGQLEALGYVVEHQVLNAADYGAPTSRKRLFLVARRDSLPIVWPKPTHGPERALPYRTAADCIDWSIPCPSIFERKRPLADATQRRIAEGIRRYLLEHSDPFLVSIDHQSSSPASCVRGMDEPLSTVTTKARHLVVSPSLIQTGYGERKGQAPRVLDIQKPLGTVVAGGCKHGLVAAFLAKHYTGVVGSDLRKPTGTVTAKDHHSLVSAHLTKFYGTSTGSALGDPMPTVTAGGWHIGAVAAFLVKYYGSGGQWQDPRHPLHTIVSKARFGLVTVTIAGEEYALVDIGMRMLQPRELATAQGFGPDYVLMGTKSQQIARIGNSVCPPVAEALVGAQLSWATEADA